MRNHRRAAYGERSGLREGGDAAGAARPCLRAPDIDALGRRTPRAAWDRALALGEEHGYRNAQASVIAPTGTIGLVMDCDTTGIEPDFALVKFKKLRRRRLLEDHQPRGAGGAAHARLLARSRDRRDRGLCRRPRRPGAGARRSTTPR